MTPDFREKARAVWQKLDLCSSSAHEQDIIAAAIKEVAEEAERRTADHFAKQEAKFRDLEARIKDAESELASVRAALRKPK